MPSGTGSVRRPGRQAVTAVLVLLAVVSIGALVIQAVSAMNDRARAAIREVELRTEALRITEEALLRAKLTEMDRTLLTLAAPLAAGADPATFERGMRARKAASPAVMDFLVLDGAGVIRSWTGQGTPPDVRQRPYVRWHRENRFEGVHVSPPLESIVHDDRWFIALSRGVRDQAGALVGIVVAVLDLEELSREVAGAAVLPGMSVALAMRDGTMLFRLPEVGDTPGEVLEGLARMEGRIPARRTSRVISPFDGRERIVSYGRIPDWPLVVMVTEDLGPVLARIAADRRETLIRWGLVALMVAGLFAVMVWLLLRRSRAEAALRRSEQRYRLTQQATGAGLWEWDIPGDRIHWDAAANALVGRPPTAGDLTYEAWKTLVHPEDLARVTGEIEGQMARGVGFTVEFRYRHADGHWRWVEGRGQVVRRDKDGRPLTMIGTHADCQARKEAEQALAAQRNRLDQLLASSPAVIYALEPGRLTPSYVSINCLAVHGWSAADMIGNGDWWFDHLHPADRDQAVARLREWLEGPRKTALSHNYRLRHGQGHYIWVEDQLAARRDDDGNILEYVGSHVDVTGRRELMSRLSRIGEVAPGMIYQYRRDAEGRDSMPYASQGIIRLFGFAPEEVAGNVAALFDRIHPDDRSRVESTILESAADLKVWTAQFRVDHPERGEIWVESRSAPELQDDGAIVWSGAAFEITERKQIEADFRRSNAELEQFAYVVSHDLRQPLRMIDSYARLLERRHGASLDGEAREFLDFITGGASHMNALLTSLLDYSRIGRRAEPPAEIPSRDLVDAALRFLDPAIAEAGADLRITGDWPMVRVSRNEGVRLFQNLIGNAVKYRAPDRPPVVTVHGATAAGRAVFSVTDNGIGIDPGQFDRLFQVFQRLNAPDAYEGTGIGLAICRKIVEHHGGAIDVASDGPDQGATFRVTLPLAGDSEGS